MLLNCGASQLPRFSTAVAEHSGLAKAAPVPQVSGGGRTTATILVSPN